MSYKRKLISLGIAASMLLGTGMPVSAGQGDNAAPVLLQDVLDTDGSQNDNGGLTIQYVDSLDEIELLLPAQVEITELPQPEAEVALPKIGTQVDPAELNASRMLNRTRSIADGSLADYIETDGGSKTYSVSLAGGQYLQVRLDLPDDEDIDYDLYILDKNGKIVAYSQYGSYLNGSAGTVSESTGYMVPLNAPLETYYIYVWSADGFSSTLPFTVNFAISIPGEYDAYEISANSRSNDNSTEASTIPVSIDTVELLGRNIHSPIDIDWYKIEVTPSSNYSKLILALSTLSSNACTFEVYTNTGSPAYHFLQKVPITNGELNVQTGTYYIMVKNTAAVFNSNDIQDYTLLIESQSIPDGIIITGLVGSESSSSAYVAYPGFAARFRSESPHPVYITGLVYSQVGDNQYASANTEVTGIYFNSYWYSQNNEDWAFSYGNAVTNASGEFTVSVVPGYVYGQYVLYHLMSIQYRDSVEFAVQVSNDPSLMDSEIAWLMRIEFTG